MEYNIDDFKDKIPSVVFDKLVANNITFLRPSQVKSINAGLFDSKNILVCTPTASGKTLVAEMAFLFSCLVNGSKAVYIVPLRALASEKFHSFKKAYPFLKFGLSSGDIDGDDSFLSDCDVIITTSEKFDSLIRHKAPFISRLGCIIIDEIHLLNDVSRGPTLEVILTILKSQLRNLQFIGLSATIGNPKELADWLNANLVFDTWRPVKLRKGILFDNVLEFDE